MGDSLYSEAAFYRLLFDDRQHDLPLYGELAAEAGSAVLELGIGTGRVALSLARAGHQVVGIDDSESMLSSLSARVQSEPSRVQARLSWRQADVAKLDLGARFALVTCPFNGLAHHHTEAELGGFFDSVRRHLTEDGRFAFDVMVPDPASLRGGSSSVPWFRHPTTGDVCRCDESASYDAATQILTLTAEIRWMEVDREPLKLMWRLRQFQPAETAQLLHSHNFEIVAGPVDLVDAVGYVCRPCTA